MDKSKCLSLEGRIEKLFSDSFGRALYDDCCRIIKEFDMKKQIECGVLVGFSGGADSVMLLSFLYEYRRRNSLDFDISLCHVNHMIRGAEALRDEEFSRSVAESLSLDITVITRDIPVIAKEKGLGLEEAARIERYSAFDKLLEEKGLGVVAVAHNASDNAETVIFNILRGSGLKGGCGIPPKRDNIIRPLLYVSSDSIRESLIRHKIDFVKDSTNDGLDYTRNYLRHVVIPSFEKVNSDPIESFTRFSSSLRKDEEYISERADEILSQLPNADNIAKDKLSELPFALFSRVLSKLVKNAGGFQPSSMQLNKAYELLKGDNFKINLPGRISFECQRGVCSVLKEVTQVDFSDFRVPLHMGINRICGFSADVIILDNDSDKSFLNVYKYSIQTELPFDIINDGLFLRFRKD